MTLLEKGSRLEVGSCCISSMSKSSYSIFKPYKLIVLLKKIKNFKMAGQTSGVCPAPSSGSLLTPSQHKVPSVAPRAPDLAPTAPPSMATSLVCTGLLAVPPLASLWCSSGPLHMLFLLRGNSCILPWACPASLQDSPCPLVTRLCVCLLSPSSS